MVASLTTLRESPLLTIIRIASSIIILRISSLLRVTPRILRISTWVTSLLRITSRISALLRIRARATRIILTRIGLVRTRIDLLRATRETRLVIIIGEAGLIVIVGEPALALTLALVRTLVRRAWRRFAVGIRKISKLSWR